MKNHNERCSAIAPLLAEYVATTNNTLTPLQRESVQQHLGYCPACHHAHDVLHKGICSAKTAVFDVDAAHLHVLHTRLDPYIEYNRAPQQAGMGKILYWAGSMAAVAALVLVFTFTFDVWSWRQSPTHAISNVPIYPPPLVARVEPPGLVDIHTQKQELDTQTLERKQPFSSVRVLASTDFDGQISGSARSVAVRFSTGYAAFAFFGGHGRALKISMPHVVVEVVGTRLYASIRNDVSFVGVTQGKVRVVSAVAEVAIHAGEEFMILADGSMQALPQGAWARHADNIYLREYVPQKVHRKSAAHDQNSVIQRFAHAEDLVNSGQIMDGLALYNALSRQHAGSTLGAMARYEAARLVGLELGDIEAAKRSLRALARRAPHEIKQQAALALCEVAHADDVCDGLNCLQELQNNPHFDFNTQRQALHLRERWDNKRCTDNH